MKLKIDHKKLVSFFSALMLLSTIFVFGPIVIYQGNMNEFDVPLILILGFLFIPFCLALLLLTFTGIILREKAHQYFVAVISGLGILLWIQGTFFVWELGVLDGTSIDWTKDTWRGVADSLIWIALLVLVIIGSRRFYKVAMYAIIFVLFSQVAVVGVTTFQKPGIWTQNLPLRFSTPDEVFQFSGDRNVIHLMLDQFGTQLFEEVLNDNSAYANDLDGFTFFKEVTTSSHVTLLSVPAFLSGQIYSNDVPFLEFTRKHYETDNIHTALFQDGYELDILTQFGFLKKREIDQNYYNIPTPYNASSEKIYINEAAFLADLVLFRYFPYYLKKLIYNNQSWFISSALLPEEYSQFEHFSANEFLNDFSLRATISRDKPVYKYIHLMTPHPPLVVGADHTFSGKVLPDSIPENFKFQAEYTMENIVQVLERLKELDLYNSSLIIIQSDHGSGIPFDIELEDGSIAESYRTFLPSDAFLPLLLIKPPYQTGSLKTSLAQGDLTDLPATISSVLHIPNQFPGRSLFDVDPSENRERKTYYSFATHRNDAMVSGYFEEFQEYVVSGSVFKIASWKKSHLLKKSVQPYTWGTLLEFHKQGNILPYLLQGWSLPEEKHIWSNGNKATFRLPVTEPETDMIELQCQIKPFLVPSEDLDKQNVVISINNTPVGEFLLDEAVSQTQRLLFPKSLIANSPYMTVRFDLPDAIPGTEVGLNDSRTLGLAFSTVIFSEYSE